MREKDKITPERMLLDGLIQVKGVWYKSNEKKADMLQRKVDAYAMWANRVVLYILMQERLNDERRKRKV